MRTTTIPIILLLLLSASWSSRPYHEDLSVHRPPYEAPSAPQAPPIAQPPSRTAAAASPPQHDVTAQLAALLQRRKDLHARQKTISGYTIQVYAGSSRQHALQARNKLYTHFPDLKPELQYSTPHYTVRVGAFLDQVEAYALYAAIRKQMPKAIIRPFLFPNNSHTFTQCRH